MLCEACSDLLARGPVWPGPRCQLSNGAGGCLLGVQGWRGVTTYWLELLLKQTLDGGGHLEDVDLSLPLLPHQCIACRTGH